MFTKILVANRGEIACRIIRTCKKLGISTVAIYSEADHKAKHVKLADEAYLLGSSDPSESYLNIYKIVEIAKASKVDAVHPGYGFLSENPDFARSCSEASICFIGPDPNTMAKMGDKVTARKLAKKAGLPILPGSDFEVDDAHALDEAWKLGFPLMVKAVDGGGGIGIHTINSINELLPIVDRTRLISQHSFGSTRLFFERYVQGASHIEVQIIGDKHGNLIHLHERDCSLQRRNQKVVEETPATKLPDKVRNKLHKFAVKLGNYINYSNAGTVEFLVSGQGNIYFLEMNTRLQVEHGVTEMVTGLDLVEMQIRVANGEVIRLSQDEIYIRGHAIEARVYPEDPDTFIPDVGIITGLHIPKGRLSRIDTALCKGYEVTLHYEPLLAKVMAWGKNRDEAIRRLQNVLLGIRLNGIKSNISLLQTLLSDSSFNCSTHHTGTVSEIIEDQKLNKCQPKLSGRMENSEQSDRQKAAAIGVALALHHSKLNLPYNPEESPWRTIARREQLLSRNSGQMGWH